MSGQLDIYEIVAACQKGERSAQKALYELFASKMMGVCMRYASNRESAEDFLQDGFIRVFDNIEKFRFEGSFEGWMRRVIVNMIIESFRKKKIETELTDEFPDKEEEGSGDFPENQVPSLGDLLALVQQLPERYRMVFNLYVLEERTHEQIAEELGISVGTSKSNLSRARKWLQERLKNAKKMEAAKI